MNIEQAKDLVKSHEGLRLKAYRDSRGVVTIGRGCNLQTSEARAICNWMDLPYEDLRLGKIALTLAQADAIFDRQFDAVLAGARLNFPGFDQLPDNAAAVICDMIFELGWAGFMEFRKFAKAVKDRDWNAAIAEMRNSQWNAQVPGRVENDVLLMKELLA
jgi:GH24 family phage-related lysozyme (muramidase)